MTEERINAIAEKTVALLMTANRRLPYFNRDTRKGGWDRMIIHEISYGSIFYSGCEKLKSSIAEKISGLGCKLISECAEADYVVLADENTSIDSAFIAGLKDGAIIVDISGNDIADTCALKDALESGKVAVYAGGSEKDAVDDKLTAEKFYFAFPSIGKEVRA